MEYKDLRRYQYEKIIQILCQYNNIDENDIIPLLRDKECKYLLLLLLKSNKCTDEVILEEIMSLKTKTSIQYNFKKAEEKLYVNKDFREKYFEIQRIIKEII
ncbi:ribose 5-phosphate isomerase [Clostridium putrefaciens]|uniref:Ribose 5-phosphate isomerase n=1 Tax=Clostridium putrefaciens TaxID=99675 RepID=A0A381J6P0_9CLOT|nr:ribose-5-phosphate isomerase [Clostridium putrefaciens]SUY46659.1 ribose 5-phosphate isomerase [Clostridium putrefaciens]